MVQCGEEAPSEQDLSVKRLLLSLIEQLISCSDSMTSLKVHKDTEPKEIEGAGRTGNTAGHLASRYRERVRKT